MRTPTSWGGRLLRESRHAVGFALAGGALFACSLITNLNPLTSDAGSADAAGDVAVDAANDATFCAQYADAGPLTYCEDFDSVTDAAALNLVESGATATLDTTDYVSPPASLLVNVPMLPDAGSTSRAYLSHGIAAEPTTVTVDFWLQVENATTGYANVMVINLAAADFEFQLVLQLYPGSYALQERVPTADGGATQVTHSATDFQWDSNWHHIVVTLSVATPKSSTLTLDDGKEVQVNSLDTSWETGVFTLDVGVTSVPQPTTWTVHIDNVLAQLSL